MSKDDLGQIQLLCKVYIRHPLLVESDVQWWLTPMLLAESVA